jgi:hypothetical protein
MSSSAYVDDAADFAKALTWVEARGPGDYKPAMERAARGARVAPGLFWRLHYRKPKIVDAAAFMNIGTAYGQRGLHRHEQTTVSPRTTLGRFLARGADALDRTADAMDRAETLKDDI